MKRIQEKLLSLVLTIGLVGALCLFSGCTKTERILTGAALGATGVGLAAGLGASSAAAGIGGAAGGGLLGGLIGGATHKSKKKVKAVVETTVAQPAQSSPLVPADVTDLAPEAVGR